MVYGLQFGKSGGDKGEYRFRHCVVASTWAFEAQGPGSIPGGGAKHCPPISMAEQNIARRCK
jgi:hypothetical protein